MPWVKTDENAPNHPKLFRAGLMAYGFWHAALSYCNRYLTDGFIPARDARLVFPAATEPEVIDAVDALVREGLLERREKERVEGWWIHDYLDYQPSRRDVIARRRIKSAAGRQGGAVSAQRRKHNASTMTTTNGHHDAQHDASPSANPVPARTVPYRPEQKTRDRGRGIVLTDDAFLAALKKNPAFVGIDIDRELGKLDAWLLTPKGRGKTKSRQRIVNWLNRADHPLAPATPAPIREQPTGLIAL